MIRSCLLASALLAASPALAETKAPEWLFVHTASAFAADGTSLVMPVEREIFGFTDRPDRLHAYLSAHEFVALWEEGEDSFRADPPNAVVTWIADGELNEAEVELRDAHVAALGGAIEYEVAFETGTPLPESATYVSLFIDSFPHDPQSAVGKVINMGNITSEKGDVLIIGGGDGCSVRKNGVCLDPE